MLSLEEARACATGTLFLGHFPTQKQRVLYVSEEDRQDRLHRRYHAAVKGRPPDEVPGPEALRFLIKAGVRLDLESGRQLLRRHIELHRPDVVFLEHFDRLHAVNPNKPEEIKPLLNFLDDLHREFGCVFRVQKHNRKEAAGQSRRKGEMLAGTIAQHGWGESSIYLTLVRRGIALVEVEAKDGDTAARFRVQYQDGRMVYGGEANSGDRMGRSGANQGRVLRAVADQPGASVEELAKAVDMSDKTIRRHLKRLEEAGEVVGHQESSKQPRRYWPNSAEAQENMLGQQPDCPSDRTDAQLEGRWVDTHGSTPEGCSMRLSNLPGRGHGGQSGGEVASRQHES